MNQRLESTRKQKEHNYKIGDKVLLQNPGKLRKVTVPYSGPYEVQRVLTNGTIMIQKGAVVQ